MSKIKVLFYVERWSSGGIEAFISNILLAENTCNRIQADIVAHTVEDSIFTEKLKSLGIGFHELSGKIRSSRNARMFRNLLRENKYDVVHLNIFHGLGLRFAKIARQEGVLVRIAHSHGAGLRKSALKPLKLILSRIGRLLWLNDATALLACSAEAGEFLFGGEAVKVINNGIDCKKFEFSEETRERIRTELGIGNSLCIGHVGRFSEEKNHEFMLDILKECLKHKADTKLIFAGDGPLIDKIKQKATALNILNSVIFLGATKNVSDYMCAMDVFILPSTIEGFGIAAIEAQASGLAVIVSDRVPSSVILTDNAYSLPLTCAAEWAEACCKITAFTANRQTGSEAVIKAGYDISHTAEKLLKIYEKESRNG